MTATVRSYTTSRNLTAPRALSLSEWLNCSSRFLWVVDASWVGLRRGGRTNSRGLGVHLACRETIARMVKLYSDGYATVEIGQQLNLDSSDIRCHLISDGVTMRPSVRRTKN